MKAPILRTLALLLVATSFTITDSRAQNDESLTGTSAKASESKSNDDTPGIPKPAKPKPTASTNSIFSPVTATSSDDRVASLAVADLREYEMLPPAVQKLIADALSLTTLNLSYKYGSDDPKNGGMDCSGTIYYLLTEAGVKDVPRDSSEMYKWVWTHGRFQAVTSSSPDTFELSRLKPGDLLFWTGTYQIDRDPPITHVMIYLGINRHTGRRVMAGASEGRRFNDKSRYGVSVFDFTLPGKRRSSDSATDLKAQFVGYGPIPGLEEVGSATESQKKPSSGN